jgi:S-(hydroxymethyl)glutathione dehydrogenase/alcohol dehydrogenase
MKTKAAVMYRNNALFEIEELDLREPSQGEILVEMKATGICRTDQHVIEGSTANPLPAVLGHEGAGVVKAVGPGVQTVKEGDHVITVWMPSCGKCQPCRSGLGHLCVRGAHLFDGYMLDGKTRFSKNGKKIHHCMFLSAFSKYIVIPEEAGVVIDKDVRLDRVCLLGCALTSGFGAATKTAKVEAGSNAAVFGFGGIGAGVLNGLIQSGANMIIVIDPNDWKEEVAKKMGATHFFNPRKTDPVKEILDLTWGVGVDYAFECWGDVKVEAQCFNAIRNKGKAIFLGAPDQADNAIPINAFQFCNNEKIIMGSLYGSCVPLVDVPKFVSLHKKGKFDLDTVVTKTFRLEEINRGFDAMKNGEVIRGVVIFD